MEWYKVNITEKEYRNIHDIITADGSVSSTTANIMTRFLIGAVKRFDVDKVIARPKFSFDWTKTAALTINDMYRYLLKWGDCGRDLVSTWACIALDSILCHICCESYQTVALPWQIPDVYIRGKLIETRKDFHGVAALTDGLYLEKTMREFGLSVDRDTYLNGVLCGVWQQVFGLDASKEEIREVMCDSYNNTGLNVFMKCFLLGQSFIDDIRYNIDVPIITVDEELDKFLYQLGNQA